MVSYGAGLRSGAQLSSSRQYQGGRVGADTSRASTVPAPTQPQNQNFALGWVLGKLCCVLCSHCIEHCPNIALQYDLFISVYLLCRSGKYKYLMKYLFMQPLYISTAHNIRYYSQETNWRKNILKNKYVSINFQVCLGSWLLLWTEAYQKIWIDWICKQ